MGCSPLPTATYPLLLISCLSPSTLKIYRDSPWRKWDLFNAMTRGKLRKMPERYCSSWGWSRNLEFKSSHGQSSPITQIIQVFVVFDLERLCLRARTLNFSIPVNILLLCSSLFLSSSDSLSLSHTLFSICPCSTLHHRFLLPSLHLILSTCYLHICFYCTVSHTHSPISFHLPIRALFCGSTSTSLLIKAQHLQLEPPVMKIHQSSFHLGPPILPAPSSSPLLPFILAILPQCFQS